MKNKMVLTLMFIAASLANASSKQDYEILGLTPQSTLLEVKTRFKKLAKELHPDRRNGESSGLVEVIQAYNRIRKSLEGSSFSNASEESVTGEVPSRNWRPGGWQKGPIDIGLSHEAGLTGISRNLGKLDDLVSNAQILSDSYERSLKKDFRAVAMDDSLPYLYRALYVFDSATLFDPPEPGKESEAIVKILRSLRALEQSSSGLLPKGNLLFSELFMAGFVTRMRAGNRHPLFGRIWDDDFRTKFGVIAPDVTDIFTSGSRGYDYPPVLLRLQYDLQGNFEIISEPSRTRGGSIDYRILYHDHFFWQVAREDLATWEKFIGKTLGDFLSFSLAETNGRNFMAYTQTERFLRHVIETGKSKNRYGIRGRFNSLCATYLSAPKALTSEDLRALPFASRIEMAPTGELARLKLQKK